MSHGYTRNTDDLQPIVYKEKFKVALVGGRDGNGYTVTERRCPACLKRGVSYRMQTNRAGAFRCGNCWYQDVQDVSGLEDLAYNAPRSDNAFMYGKRVQG